MRQWHIVLGNRWRRAVVRVPSTQVFLLTVRIWPPDRALRELMSFPMLWPIWMAYSIDPLNSIAHTSEQCMCLSTAYQRAIREQKLAAEVSAANKERDFYLSKVDRAKALEAQQARKRKVQAALLTTWHESPGSS